MKRRAVKVLSQLVAQLNLLTASLRHRNFQRRPRTILTFRRFDYNRVVSFHVGKGCILSTLRHFSFTCHRNGMFGLCAVNDRYGRISNCRYCAVDRSQEF